MQPNLFTVVIKRPGFASAIITGLDLPGITAVALGAEDPKSVEAFPAQWRDSTATVKEIEDGATQAILACARPGGFDVEFVGAGQTPKWASEVIRALDFSARRDREIKRLALIALATGTPAQAERATARAVDILSHAIDKTLFELEQRARLVDA